MIWNIDPVLFSFGVISVHWYGVLFTVALFTGYHINKYMFVRDQVPIAGLDSLLVYVVVGIIVGARLAHCLFYDPQFYMANPMKILAIWEGGLASHGGGVGAIAGIFLYSKKSSVSFIWMLDRIVISTALFGFFVRVANFLNSEIIGASSNLPWAVVFERVDSVSRHPAQLYEALGYFIIFVILFLAYSNKKIRDISGALVGLFLTMTFSLRLLVEFVKEPQASYSLDVGLNTGQLLSLPFLAFGILVLLSCWLRNQPSKLS